MIKSFALNLINENYGKKRLSPKISLWRASMGASDQITDAMYSMRGTVRDYSFKYLD